MAHSDTRDVSVHVPRPGAPGAPFPAPDHLVDIGYIRTAGTPLRLHLVAGALTVYAEDVCICTLLSSDEMLRPYGPVAACGALPHGLPARPGRSVDALVAEATQVFVSLPSSASAGRALLPAAPAPAPAPVWPAWAPLPPGSEWAVVGSPASPGALVGFVSEMAARGAASVLGGWAWPVVAGDPAPAPVWPVAAPPAPGPLPHVVLSAPPVPAPGAPPAGDVLVAVLAPSGPYVGRVPVARYLAGDLPPPPANAPGAPPAKAPDVDKEVEALRWAGWPKAARRSNGDIEYAPHDAAVVRGNRAHFAYGPGALGAFGSYSSARGAVVGLLRVALTAGEVGAGWAPDPDGAKAALRALGG